MNYPQHLRLAFHVLLSLAFVSFLFSPEGVSAQESQPPVRGEELQVYLVTIGPGDAVWQQFGHNAIRISNSADGTDRVFNYGVFDFESDGFVNRFVLGTAIYSLEIYDFPSTVALYTAENRTIWTQTLNLAPAERAALLEFLLWNAREENRYYRYDYFRDNCSTRVADALDRALGGNLRKQLQKQHGRVTYREAMLQLTSSNPAASWGMDLALSSAADTTLPPWYDAYIPMRLWEYVSGMSLQRPDHSVVPLVSDEKLIFEAQRDPPSPATSRILPALTVGGFAAIGILGLGIFANRNRAAAVLLALTLTIWSLAVGLTGSLLSLLWLFTEHVSTYGNQNLLQSSPLALILAVIGPLAVLRGRARWPTVGLTVAFAAMSLLGWLMHALPEHYSQVNGRFVALALPIHVAVALATWMSLFQARQIDIPPSFAKAVSSRNVAVPVKHASENSRRYP